MSSIINYESYCKSFGGNTNDKERAKLLFYLRDWLYSVVRTDENGNGYTSYDYITRIDDTCSKCDALSYITKVIVPTVRHIENNLRNKIQRENVLMPVYKANEFNSASINWLSKRSGRTIREKLSGSKSIMAVRRKMSLDTGENRLFKAFMIRLEEKMQVKESYLPKEYLDEKEVIFHEQLVKLLRDDNLTEIKRWENLPPNNTLLSDRYYSAIWRAWNKLQKLDELLKKDNENIDSRLKTLFTWKILRAIRKICIIPQSPVIYNYDEFRLDFIEDNINGIGTDNEKFSISFKDNSIFISFDQNFCVLQFIDGKLDVLFNGIDKVTYHLTADNLDSVIDKITNNVFGKYLRAESYLKMVKPLSGKNAIVNLFSLRPSCFFQGSIHNMPYRILYQSYEREIKGEDVQKIYELDCRYADAVLLSNRVKSYTLQSILDNGDFSSRDFLPELLEQVNDYVHTDSITIIFPDNYIDFQLSDVRSKARIYYNEVQTLPKSIAAMFGYMTTASFQETFSCGDHVIVIDYIGDMCCMTLIGSIYDEFVEAKIPEIKGIIWEHHPAVTERCGCNDDNDETLGIHAQQVLIDNGLTDGEINLNTIFENFDLEGLVKENDRISFFINDKQWFRFNDKVTKKIASLTCNVTSAIDKFIDDHKKLINNSSLRIISLNSHLIYKGNIEFLTLNNEDILKGAHKLEAYSAMVEIALWRDYLPNIAIKRLFGSFDLVKNSTIVPELNSTQTISISNIFTLSKNMPDYHFLLVRNDLNNKIQYEAVIKNSNFPLKNDVQCKLRMTYTYGADEPYVLIFEPLDKINSGFSEAKVEWKKVEKFRYKDLPFPSFPEEKTWEELSNSTDKRGNKIDLLERVINVFDMALCPRLKMDFDNCDVQWLGTIATVNTIINDKKASILFAKFNFELKDINIEDRDKFLNTPKFDIGFNKISYSIDEIKRYVIEKPSFNWQSNNKGNFCFAVFKRDNQYIQIAFYESNFIFAGTFSKDIQKMFFSISEVRHGNIKYYKAIYIYAGNEDLSFFQNDNIKFYQAINIRRGNIVSHRLIGGLFALHTVFFNGRSIKSSDCPSDFKNSVEKYEPIFFKTYINEPEGSAIKPFLFTILSLISFDFGEPFYNYVYTRIADYKNKPGQSKLQDEVGYALGDLTTKYQMELFNKLLGVKPQKVICILSKAIWKNKQFITNAPKEILFKYFDYAIILLNEYILKVTYLKEQDILKYLEYILAIFRLRELDDENINMRLSLNNSKIQDLYKIVETLINRKIKLYKSRVQLKTNKSKEFADIPDLYYALLVYITGDAGESEIKISGIDEG